MHAVAYFTWLGSEGIISAIAQKPEILSRVSALSFDSADSGVSEGGTGST